MNRVILIMISVMMLGVISCGKNETIRDNIKLKTEDYLGLGVADYKKGDLTSSRIFLELALKNAYTLDNLLKIIDISHALADVCLRLEDFEAASNIIYKAKYLSETESITNYDFYIYLEIGKLKEKTAKDKQDYQTALDHFMKALSIAKTDREKAIAYNSIGISHNKIGNFNDALSYFDMAIKINDWLKDYDNLGDNYYNIGEVYFKRKQYPLSLTNHLQSLECDKTAENRSGIIENLLRIADIYILQNDNARAMNYLKRAHDMALAIESEKKLSEIEKKMKSIK